MIILENLKLQAERSLALGRKPHAQQHLSDGRLLLITAYGNAANVQFDFILDGNRCSEFEAESALRGDPNIFRVENMGH